MSRAQVCRARGGQFAPNTIRTRTHPHRHVFSCAPTHWHMCLHAAVVYVAKYARAPASRASHPPRCLPSDPPPPRGPYNIPLLLCSYCFTALRGAAQSHCKFSGGGLLVGLLSDRDSSLAQRVTRLHFLKVLAPAGALHCRRSPSLGADSLRIERAFSGQRRASVATGHVGLGIRYSFRVRVILGALGERVSAGADKELADDSIPRGARGMLRKVVNHPCRACLAAGASPLLAWGLSVHVKGRWLSWRKRPSLVGLGVDRTTRPQRLCASAHDCCGARTCLPTRYDTEEHGLLSRAPAGAVPLPAQQTPASSPHTPLDLSSPTQPPSQPPDPVDQQRLSRRFAKAIDSCAPPLGAPTKSHTEVAHQHFSSEPLACPHSKRDMRPPPPLFKMGHFVWRGAHREQEGRWGVKDKGTEAETGTARPLEKNRRRRLQQ